MLTRVREQASQTAGIAVTQAVVVVPPSWGPQRRTRLRHAAHHAGLTDITMVDAATALAHRHARQASPQGAAVVLVCRFSDGQAEATILRANAEAFETLATIDQTTLDAAAVIRRVLEAGDLNAAAVTTVMLDATLLPAIAHAPRN